MSGIKQSSCGYVIEFDHSTGSGLIREERTNRVLSVHYNSFKQRSKRNLTKDNAFIGELFDFDVAVKHNGDEHGLDTFEAVNVKHRVLKCYVEECPRLKAFTNVKALEDHVNLRHNSKTTKKEEVTSPSMSVLIKKSKKQRRSRPKTIIIRLSSPAAAAVVGRFIGKQGVNLKRLEQRFQAKLQLLDSRNVLQPVQVLVKPHAGVIVDLELIGKVLRSTWGRCIEEQEESDKTYQQRLQASKDSATEQEVPEFQSDPRYRDDLKFRLRRLKRQGYLVARKYHQTQSSVRVQERYASLNREEHRSAATGAGESRQKSMVGYHPERKIKKDAKEQQWLIDKDELHLEQLFEVL